MKKLRIGLLMGGYDEAFLSIQTGRTVFEFLDRERFEVIPINWKTGNDWSRNAKGSLEINEKKYPDLSTLLKDTSIDCMYICLHGEKEADGRLISLFEYHQVHYTGNGFLSCVTGQNKYLSKLLFDKLGFRTPKYRLITLDSCYTLEQDREDIENYIGFPCILKPTGGGSSQGITPIDSFESLMQSVPILLTQFKTLLLEEYVKGREVSVGACGRLFDNSLTILPAATIRFEGGHFSNEHKRNNSYDIVIPAEISPEEKRRLHKTTAGIHTAMGFEALSRTDYIVAEKGIYALETNINPGLSKHSIYPKMIEASGLSLQVIVNKLVDWAFSRRSTDNAPISVPGFHEQSN